jgi:hypothetical protein
VNIRFEYLYRDAGNYKNWGETVFSNPNEIECSQLRELITNALIDKEYFVASKVGIADLHFPTWDSIEDHDWHEFHTVQSTVDCPTDEQGRTVEEFIEVLREASRSA